MAEIHVQRRSSGAWLWLVAIIGLVLLLWAVVRGSHTESELLDAPAVLLIGDPQDLVNAHVMTRREATLTMRGPVGRAHLSMEVKQ